MTAFAFSSGSGFDDLVVGNNGDGVLALFEGGADGLSLISTATDPDLPSPTALVFAGLTGGQVQFYAATEGREAAALVALSLSGASAAPCPRSRPSRRPAVAQLVPLQESSLALVGTLLIVTIDSPAGRGRHHQPGRGRGDDGRRFLARDGLGRGGLDGDGLGRGGCVGGPGPARGNP